MKLDVGPSSETRVADWTAVYPSGLDAVNELVVSV
jgi:hypothetical protein